ncbi:GGDEF domain-containing protein, partial [Acidithiobacillus sp. IBUN Pt1247-S3]|uniref:GGDEF domain-containing protein n=1 Tax=Acidithiobacillus sp. IBUN Pt1247-S3 TaxID=3166642 RepID=UPI0034E586E9
VYSGTEQAHGTLCAVDRRSVCLDTEQLRLLEMLSVLLTREWEHERLILTLQQENDNLNADVYQDALTAVSNRRALFADLNRALANSQRFQMRVQLAFIDLDGFKLINDRYGHQAGDLFLQQVARRLRNGIREGDFIGRYGGDEFVIFGLCQHNDPDQAQYAWETRLQGQLVGEYSLGETQIDYAGASIGVVTAEPDESAEALLARADHSMYNRKKQRHRDRIQLQS